MEVIVLGSLVNDFLTMVVFRFSDILPGKHWFLVITPVLEGIMGGKSAFYHIVPHNETLVHSVPSSTMAAETSYMRDVSEPQYLYVADN